MNRKKIISVITASFLLVGCGGGSSNSTSITPSETTEVTTKIGQGYYVDTAVQGIYYVCGTAMGITDKRGTFNFEEGKNCTFMLGNILLREVNASLLENNVTILEDNTKVAQLLQTLDSDGEASNGITILEEAHDVVRERNITKVPRDNTLLVEIKDDLKIKLPEKYRGRIVTEEEALRHIENTRQGLKDEGKRTQYSVEEEITRPKHPLTDGNDSNRTRPERPQTDGNDSNRTRPERPQTDGNDSNRTRPERPQIDGNDSNRTRPNMPNIDNNTTNQDNNSNNINGKFSKVLAIPALAPYEMIEGYKVFKLDINESTTEFFDDVQTKTFGVNANVLGQTIRMHNGDEIKLVYNNNLNEATTMHGHGMHVPAIMDGGPINKIQPHTTWIAQYTVNQTACTNWYHPHLMGKTAEHVYNGLAGLIIIDDDTSDALNLPKTYGVDDIPIVLQDKFFDANGQIDYSPTRMQIMRGYTGGYMLANGVINPHVNVPAKKVRFRLLNGSNASLYKLEFTNKHEFYQIATDNSFLEEPVKLTQLVLTPGERGEIVVDFSNDLNKSFVIKDLTLNKEIMKINITTASSEANQPLPSILMTQEKLNPANAVRTRKFVLGMSQGKLTINGKSMDINRIDEFVPENDIEIWELTNMMGIEHNFHIHATHFYPLERNGSPENLTPAEHGYKDVIRLAGQDTVKVIVKMTDFVDDTTGYMYHCHFLEHEDNGMMGQFAVTNGDALINIGGSNSTGSGMGNGSQSNRRN